MTKNGKQNGTEPGYLELFFWMNSSVPALHQLYLLCERNTVFITGIGISIKA